MVNGCRPFLTQIALAVSMSERNILAITLNAHLPFIRQNEFTFSYEEYPLFETISETLLPLLEMFERLETDQIPFRLGFVLSPALCYMLTDPVLIEHYLSYTNAQIAFGAGELERKKDNPELSALVKHYYDSMIKKQTLFTEHYENNLLNAFSYFQKKGRIEIIAAPATNCFLPFYKNYPEIIRAQFETAIVSYNDFFNKSPAGFWLPEMAYHPRLDKFFQEYNIQYTMIDTHTALLSSPVPETGNFYPLKTTKGTFLLVKDFYASRDIMDREHGFPDDPSFRNFFQDAADDLPLEEVKLFLANNVIRMSSGYKYYSMSRQGKQKKIYDIQKARTAARERAGIFLERRITTLQEAAKLINNNADGSSRNPVSLCVWNADFLGRFWHEGVYFLEELFRKAAADGTASFVTPSEYVFKQPSASFQVIKPKFSSAGFNGYAESWLDASNGKYYRHLIRAVCRMTELAERLKNESGIKERALNQAARELLLALSSEWPRLISDFSNKARNEWGIIAKNQLESHLRNFTTIYEALGSTYISTRFLTELETNNNVFPKIDYRVFRRKK